VHVQYRDNLLTFYAVVSASAHESKCDEKRCMYNIGTTAAGIALRASRGIKLPRSCV
jgi:hypothetical protein